MALLFDILEFLKCNSETDSLGKDQRFEMSIKRI